MQLATYGPPPAGSNLFEIRVGDVIADPTLISIITGISLPATATYPNPHLPCWQQVA